MISIVWFLLCAAVIFFAGKKLSFYGDSIAELTGIGRAWIGLILLASVTSLPELMVGISSSAILQSPDLAVGDIFGSCAFNLGILALMDAFVPKHKSLFGTASQSHVLAAAMGTILLVMAGLGLFLPNDIVLTTGIGVTSISFIVIYLISIRLIYRFQLKTVASSVPDQTYKTYKTAGLKKAVLMFSVYAVCTIVPALFLPHFAEQIAESTGLGKTFVGTLFLAASTSLPEIAVSLAATRMGAIDLSVGNLLGSNIFNIVILAIDDLFYTKGHLLKDASDVNLVSVLAAILMSAIVIIGITFRSENKRYFMAWDAVLVFAVYIINLVLLYRLTN